MTSLKLVVFVATLATGCASAAAQPGRAQALADQLRSPDSIVRTTAACGLKDLGLQAAPVIVALIEAMADATPVPADTCGHRNWSWRGRDDTTTPGREAAAALVSVGQAAFDSLL